MNVIKQPSEFNLSSMISDFVISSTNDILFEVRLNEKTILKEVYSPDNEDLIYVRGRALGKTLQKYLYGNDLEEGIQANISNTFTVYINDAEYASYNILFCRTYTDLIASDFFEVNTFLTPICDKKYILPSSTEYIAFMVRENMPIKVSITYKNDDVLEESDLRVLKTLGKDQFETVNISFYIITDIFAEIDPNSILSYKIYSNDQIINYLIDRTAYIFTLEFIYRNSFDVPDSITTHGIVMRKWVSTFETSKINDISRKSNIKRSDSFSVSSGKIFSSKEYDRYREMFNSEDVRIFFKGDYRKIVITEESMNEPLRKGNLPPVRFTFEFANDLENNILLGSMFDDWILESGQWEDQNIWRDDRTWKDDTNS